MSVEATAHYPIQDRAALEEFADALTDRAVEIERDVARLRKSPDSREIMADLFRAMHNIKGDAALCKFPLGITVAHPMESVMSRFREGEIAFSDLLAETLLLAVDRLELATDTLLKGKSLSHLELPALIQGLEQLATTSADEVDASCSRLIEQVTGFQAIGNLASKASSGNSFQRAKHNASTNADLLFFRTLALQFESRSPLFKGRTTRILRLALETNKVKGTPVDPTQLEAAVYVHDVGMMFLPETTWLKVGRLNDTDKIVLQNHPGFAAGLLQRMPGWEAAAEMVSQHHEMPDGAGYPHQLKGEAICAGAKILAIVDAFEAVMLKHSHRGKNRSVLRAIAEINACDKQFAAEWIGPFNTVIRKTLENT